MTPIAFPHMVLYKKGLGTTHLYFSLSNSLIGTVVQILRFFNLQALSKFMFKPSFSGKYFLSVLLLLYLVSFENVLESMRLEMNFPGRFRNILDCS